MEKEAEDTIKIKIAISLNTLLSRNKKLYNSNKNNKDIIKSYNDIALAADLRKATVSDVFNAKVIPEIPTLFQIIKGMGYTLIDFSKIYSSIGDFDIANFKT